MSRINYIYKLLPSLWFTPNPMRGLVPTSMWNGSSIERNTGRMFRVFVFLSLVLPAMQVVLGTGQLGDEPAFIRAAYGFAVASLLLVALCALVGTGMLVWHVRYKIILPWSMGPAGDWCAGSTVLNPMNHR